MTLEHLLFPFTAPCCLFHGGPPFLLVFTPSESPASLFLARNSLTCSAPTIFFCCSTTLASLPATQEIMAVAQTSSPPAGNMLANLVAVVVVAALAAATTLARLSCQLGRRGRLALPDWLVLGALVRRVQKEAFESS